MIMMLSRISSSTRRGELTLVTVMQRRARGQLLDRAAVLDRRHGNRILGLHAADAARRPHGVGAFDMGPIGREVARRHRHVDRLDHDAALPVQHAEGVGELEDVAERLEVAVAPAALAVADVRRAVDRAEIDDVAADVQVARGVTGVQHEVLGSGLELRLDELAPEAHDLRALVDQCAGAREHVARRGAADLEAGLLAARGRRRAGCARPARPSGFRAAPRDFRGARSDAASARWTGRRACARGVGVRRAAAAVRSFNSHG